MKLASYVDNLRDGNPYKEAAKEIGISHGNLHNIISGKTTQPPPDVLYKISRRYGKDVKDSQQIYATLMRLSGHLDWMPNKDVNASGSQHQQHQTLILPEIYDISEKLKEFSNVERIEIVRLLRSTINLAMLIQKTPDSINERRDNEVMEIMPDHINDAFKQILDHDEEAYEDLMKHLSKTLDEVDEEELIRA